MRKTLIYIVLSCAALAGCVKESVDTDINAETITVQGAGYTKALFVEGCEAFSDKNAVITGDLHPCFSGFEFLVSPAGSSCGGYIIPDADGPVFIIAAESPQPVGWTLVSNSTSEDNGIFYCKYGTTNIKLNIYSSYARAGVKVPIPITTSEFSPCPIAKRIRYEQISPDGIGVNEIQIKGEGVDIRKITASEKVFPYCRTFVFNNEVLKVLGGPMNYATGLSESRGVSQIRCGESVIPTIAYESESAAGWTSTGKSIHMGPLEYFILTKPDFTAGEWIDIPFSGKHSTLVLGQSFVILDQPDYGTPVTSSRSLGSSDIDDACITKLPDGRLLAACSGAKEGDGEELCIFMSEDKGETWNAYGNYLSEKSLIYENASFFTFDDYTCLIGTGKKGVGLFVSKTKDGVIWSRPTDWTNGVLLGDKFSLSPAAAVEYDGKLWKSLGIYVADFCCPFLLNVSHGTDILNLLNWTASSVLTNLAYEHDGRQVGPFSNGNLICTGTGELVDLVSTASEDNGLGTLLHYSKETNSLSFNADSDAVCLPGGGKPFCVKYDAVSNLYWAVTNPEETFEDRSTLSLFCSPDLHFWEKKCDVLSSEDKLLHAFQKPDWIIDGDDIVLVACAAYPEMRGLPKEQMKANKLVFQRIENFRNR